MIQGAQGVHTSGGRPEDQVNVVGDRPRAHGRVLVRGEVVEHYIQPVVWPPVAQGLQKRQELPPSFAGPDPVVDLPGGQVEGADQVHDPVVAVVGGA
jgi:hypothetical protein